ncbi:RDD family protein [Pseudalkalibacillus salsuginis]|uniref:RDD family protein n=1 Tax=Pseudalkalibacillus salsuginis TaxID=2910972 RepID=UPI001F162386|nr:RDD family protein [Pseudalkalibacillus salsuginis]MCF6408130.1 RDD family protein [Pseudalkalibacillus salsuginis]
MEIRKSAGLGLRILASLMDVIIILTIISVCFYFIKGEYRFTWPNGLTWQLFYTLYLTVTPVLWNGYIIGKRIFKIRIKRYKDNENVTIINMFLREVIGYYVISIITFGISLVVSLFMVIFREDKRAVHDFIGGTYVSKD